MWALGSASVAALAMSGTTARAATICVGQAAGCHHTIRSALNAAHDGDRIAIRPGTYAGGVTITKSVRLVGAGAGATVISGGGPVVTVGTFLGATEPTVSIAGVTITGGRTSSTPTDVDPGGVDFIARGGGVFVPPAADFAPGATVTIDRSVVSGNRAAPSASIRPAEGQGPACPDGRCPFAAAEGGGIDTWGSMTVTHTLVSGNTVAGPVTSDADGAGIWTANGDLVVADSALVGNRAVAVAPNGRFAEGGGVFAAFGGTVTIERSSISHNRVRLTSTFPAMAGDQLIELQAHGGALQISDGIPTTVDRARLVGNFVSASDPQGEPLGFDSAALVNDSPLTMSRTLIAGNRSVSVGALTTDAGPAGGALEADGGGTIDTTRIVGNQSFDAADDAALIGAVAVLNFSDHDALPLTIRRSVIAGNSSEAVSRSGTAIAQGGGLFNNSLLSLDHTAVSGNRLSAVGPAGATEEGGGIWSGAELSGPPVELSLTDSAITGNVLAGGDNLSRRGGGLFTTFPVTPVRTLIAGNRPDDCFGCAAASAAPSLSRTAPGRPRSSGSRSAR
jgi:hypothetical protein